MKRILEIPIRCGDKTCAESPGRFCPQLRCRSFGQDWFCQLFPDRSLKGGDGWLLRHPQCLKLERPMAKRHTKKWRRPSNKDKP